MVVPGESDSAPDQLSGEAASRSWWVAAALAGVLITGGVLVAEAAHPSSRGRAAHATATGSPTPVAVVRRIHIGSVFLQHLPACTRTDHHHRLTVAVGVRNIGGQALQLISGVGRSTDPFAIRPFGSSFGPGPCGGSRAAPLRIESGSVTVVRLRFYVANKCPNDALVSARVAFDGGHAGVVHADSSQLADLSKLGFTQCT
jgi:hypothetical protein